MPGFSPRCAWLRPFFQRPLSFLQPRSEGGGQAENIGEPKPGLSPHRLVVSLLKVLLRSTAEAAAESDSEHDLTDEGEGDSEQDNSDADVDDFLEQHFFDNLSTEPAGFEEAEDPGDALLRELFGDAFDNADGPPAAAEAEPGGHNDSGGAWWMHSPLPAWIFYSDVL